MLGLKLLAFFEKAAALCIPVPNSSRPVNPLWRQSCRFVATLEKERVSKERMVRKQASGNEDRAQEVRVFVLHCLFVCVFVECSTQLLHTQNSCLDNVLFLVYLRSNANRDGRLETKRNTVSAKHLNARLGHWTCRLRSIGIKNACSLPTNALRRR